MRILASTLVACLVALAASNASAQSAADPTGHWEGTVTAPMVEIEFEVDVVRDASGALTATYGQKATGARGLPLTPVTIEGRTFAFVLFNGGANGGRFKGEILPDGKTITLTVVDGKSQGQSFTFDRPRIIIGRLGADFAIEDPEISRWHCVIEVRGNEIRLRDLDSRNGTFVNGREITEAQALQSYDQIRVGNTELVFVAAQRAE